MNAREFIAEIGRVVLNQEVTLEAMYMPEKMYNWTIDSFTEDSPEAMTIISSGHINFLGLDIYRHTNKQVLCVSRTGVAEVHIDFASKKILNWSVHVFKASGTGEIKI